jgi:drug/metabolite transporter (DMT)-like permease
VKKSGGRILPLLILMTILFGLTFIATKQALSGLGVFQVVFSRHILALIPLTLFLWFDKRKFFIARKDLHLFLALTLVEPVGFFIFETYGIRYTSPSMVSIIIATIPVFSMVFALGILKEKVNLIAILGIFISLLGVYFIVSMQEKSSLAPFPLLGNLLVLGAAISAGLYNVLCRKLAQTYSPWTITFYQAVVASIVFFPLSLYFDGFVWEADISTSVVYSILYLSLGGTFAYFLLNYTLRHLATYKVAIFANLIPVVTISASWLIYGELLSIQQFAGALVVIVGIYLTYYKRKRRIPHS